MYLKLDICKLKIKKKKIIKLSCSLCALKTAGSKSITGFVLAAGGKNFLELYRSARVAVD